MKKLVIFCAIALMLFSCGEEKKESNSPKQLDFDAETTTANPADLLTTKYIKLETNDNCLVGNISQIESTDEYIFILDQVQTKILVFDHSGKYIGNVGRQGKGPEEFNRPKSIFIDNYNKCIVVVEGTRFIRYSLTNNFEFISAMNLESNAGAAEATKNGNVIYECYDEEIKKQYAVVDKDSKIINSLVDKLEVSVVFSTMKPMYKHNNEIFSYNNIETIVYKLSENEAIPFYDISFGKESIAPISFHQKIKGIEVNKMLATIDEAGYVASYSIYETTKALWIQFSMGIYINKGYVGFWDKETDKTYCFEQEDFPERMNIGAYVRVVGVVSDYFAAPLDIETLREKKDEGAEINSTLLALVDESKEGDNPILFLLNCK